MAAILDHIGLGYADYDRAKTFFSEALAPLGIGLVMEVGEGNERACGFGRGKRISGSPAAARPRRTSMSPSWRRTARLCAPSTRRR